MKAKTNYKISHPDYGTWWITSIYKFSKLTDTSLSYLYYNLKRGKNKVKGWTIEPTDENFDEIPYKYINPSPEFIIQWYNEQPKEFLDAIDNLKKISKEIIL